MTECCSGSGETGSSGKRHCCPVNGQEYKEVPVKTILHHIMEPWSWDMKQQSYYFCEDPECNVVYFGEDNSVITTSALRTPVGIKERDPDTLLCYCFGVSRYQAAENREIKRFVMDQTRKGLCGCDTRNPSGRCCLKDFPKE